MLILNNIWHVLQVKECTSESKTYQLKLEAFLLVVLSHFKLHLIPGPCAVVISFM